MGLSLDIRINNKSPKQARDEFQRLSGVSLDDAANTLARNFSNATVTVSGNIWAPVFECRAEWANLKFSFRNIGQADSYIYIENLQSDYQNSGLGKGKKMLANLWGVVELTRTSHIALQAVSANSKHWAGAFFWARAGVRAQALPPEIRQRRNAIAGELPADTLAQLDRFIDGGGDYVHDIANLKHLFAGTTLGYYLLQPSCSYEATLRADDTEAVARLKAFTNSSEPVVQSAAHARHNRSFLSRFDTGMALTPS